MKLFLNDVGGFGDKVRRDADVEIVELRVNDVGVDMLLWVGLTESSKSVVDSEDCGL